VTLSGLDWQEDLPPEAEQRREVFARFGLAAYQGQCLERQVAILLAATHNPEFLHTPPEGRDAFFDREFRKTLGNLTRALTDRVKLLPDFRTRLEEGVRLRNWLAHDYFWERAADLLVWDGRERMISELQAAADLLGELDRELTAVSDAWAVSLGLTPAMIEAELDKLLGREGT